MYFMKQHCNCHSLQTRSLRFFKGMYLDSLVPYACMQVSSTCTPICTCIYICTYIYTLRDRRIPYHSVTYHLNLTVGHKVHLSHHTFVIAQLFRENNNNMYKRPPQKKTPPHSNKLLHLIWWGELRPCRGGVGGCLIKCVRVWVSLCEPVCLHVFVSCHNVCVYVRLVMCWGVLEGYPEPCCTILCLNHVYKLFPINC